MYYFRGRPFGENSKSTPHKNVSFQDAYIIVLNCKKVLFFFNLTVSMWFLLTLVQI